MSQIPEQVKQTVDLAAIGTAGTVNFVDLANPYITATAGLLAVIWSLIRLYEWASARVHSRRRNDY